jgi:DNA-binding transcriptional LysR family regulator
MWLSLDQIQCLKAIQESGSMNAAAERLHKAKSAISYTLKKLEEQLGFTVVDRSEYRIRLTAKGEAFLHKAEKILEQMESLEAEVLQIASGLESRVRMSATAIFPLTKLTPVLKQLMSEFPSTELTFHREILSGERMLREDQVDIAIFENLQNSLDLEAKLIDRIHLQLVVAKDHPFLKIPKQKQNLEGLLSYPHVIQRSTLPTELTMGIPERSKKWTVSDLDSKRDLILNGLGWGRLPQHLIEEDLKLGRLTLLPHLNYDHRVDIYLCKKKSKPFGPVTQKIWDSY